MRNRRSQESISMPSVLFYDFAKPQEAWVLAGLVVICRSRPASRSDLDGLTATGRNLRLRLETIMEPLLTTELCHPAPGGDGEPE